MVRSDLFEGIFGIRTVDKRTICEIHREIYDAIVLDDINKAVTLLEEAFIVGRKMAAKLIKRRYNELIVSEGASRAERKEIRAERMRLTELLKEVENG